MNLNYLVFKKTVIHFSLSFLFALVTLLCVELLIFKVVETFGLFCYNINQL